MHPAGGPGVDGCGHAVGQAYGIRGGTVGEDVFEVVAVDVYQTGCHDLPGGVQRVPGIVAGDLRLHGGHPAIAERHIPDGPNTLARVYDLTALQQQVKPGGHIALLEILNARRLC